MNIRNGMLGLRRAQSASEEVLPDQPPTKRDRFWLTTPRGFVAATWFWPPSAARQSAAVIIVPGFAHEERTMATGLSAMAETFASAGLAALVFDLEGTAQSAGAFDDADIVERWQEDVRAVVEHVRTTGFSDIAVVGVRTGSLLSVVSLNGHDLSALVLWAPVTSGRRYGRELRLLQRVSNTASSLVADSGESATSIEIAGFAIPSHVIDDLRVLDIKTLTQPPARHVLVIDGPTRSHEDAVAQLRSIGADVDEIVGAGTEEWLYQTMDGSDIPVDDVDAVVSWVRRRTTTSPRLEHAPPGEPSPVVQEFGHGNALIRETLVGLGPGDLTAVWCEPIEPTKQPSSAVRVLVSAVGPGRSFVDFARDEAAAGRSSLRFDLSGFGTSPRRPGQTWNGYYSSEGSDDIRAAVDYIRDTVGRHVVVIGFCASAWSTLQSGPRDEIVALAALNVHLYVRNSRSSILNNKASTRLQRAIDRRLSRNRRPKLYHFLYRTLPLPAVPIRWADAFLERDIRILLLFDAHDDGLVYLRRRMPHRWKRHRSAGRLHLQTYPALGHSLEGSHDRSQLMADLRDRLAAADPDIVSPEA